MTAPNLGTRAFNPPAPSSDDQRVAGAKSRVCAGYEKIHRTLDAFSRFAKASGIDISQPPRV